MSSFTPVRLIASDLDGTLLPQGAREFPDATALFAEIERLYRQGSLFCVASGRSYLSLRALFAPVADCMAFLCHNGAAAYYLDELLYYVPLPAAPARALIRQIRTIPECEARVSTLKGGYIFRTGDGRYRPSAVMAGVTHVVTSCDEIPDEAVMISAYCAAGTTAPAAHLLPHWRGTAAQGGIVGVVTGPQWLDFTVTDKGEGLRRLCAAFGIPAAATVAFGDNFNDVSMLDLAGQPFLMHNADAALRQKYPCQTDDVLQSLREI